MNREMLDELIELGSTFAKGRRDNEQTIKDWAFEVESFLRENNKYSSEVEGYIKAIKSHGNVFGDVQSVVSYLKQSSKTIQAPSKSKQSQIFIAMWFADEMKNFYTKGYKTVAEELGFVPIRIDEKEFNTSIIDEICIEIKDSVAIIADLTGNRGGVYYEAGIARGLQMCKHPIELILTCRKDYFENTDSKPHFDVQGNSILIYSDVNDLKEKLRKRIKATVSKVVEKKWLI